MGSCLVRRSLPLLAFTALLISLVAAPALVAQGGEPQSFAIRSAKVVPVSGPPMENATVATARRFRSPSRFGPDSAMKRA